MQPVAARNLGPAHLFEFADFPVQIEGRDLLRFGVLVKRSV